MEQDDFFKTVGTSKVLTAEETLDIALHMKELAPHNKLTFPNKKRIGTWMDHFFSNVCFYSYVRVGSRLQQNFSITIPKVRIDISSIYFLNVSRTQLSVNFTSRNGNVRKLENRLHQGQQLYEAVFDPPVRVGLGNHTITFTNPTGGYYQGSQIQGQSTLQDKDVTISIPSSCWYFVVGFKLRKA